MALNSSGPISLAGATAGQSIAVELGQSSTGQISLNDTAVRNLAGVPSGAITMPTNFWGKSNVTYYIAKTGRGDGRLIVGTMWATVDTSGNFYGSSSMQYYACPPAFYDGGILKTDNVLSQSGSVVYTGNGWNWDYVNIKYDVAGSSLVGAGAFASNLMRMVKFNTSLGVVSQGAGTGITLNGNGASIRPYVDTGIGTDSSGNVYAVYEAKVTQYCYDYRFTLIIKTNSTMSTLSWARYQGSATSSIRPYRSSAVSPAGNVYILSQPSTSSRDALTVIDSTGTLTWSYDINDGGVSQWTNVGYDSSGNIYLTGYNTTLTSPSYVIVTKLNSSGTVQWSQLVRKTFAGYSTSINTAPTVAVDSSGNVYVNFMVVSSNTSEPRQWITAKFNSSGTSQWVRYYAINITGSGLGWYGGAYSSNRISISPTNSVLYQTAPYTRSGGAYYEMFLMWTLDGSKTGTYTLGGGDYTETVVYGVSDATVTSYSPSWTYTSQSTNACNTATVGWTSGGGGYPNITATTSYALNIVTRTQLT